MKQEMVEHTKTIASRLTLVWISLIVVSILLITILASVPPTSRDALVHHLAVPKIYIEHGKMVELPSMDFSYFPMNLDLLYLIPLYFNRPIAAKYIHFCFSLLTALLLYRYLKGKLNRNYGLMGALLFLTIPVIVKLSVTVYVDLGLIFFTWASIYYLFKWVDNGYKIVHLIVSAIFCGLCLGTKYNGLIVLFILTSMIPIFYSRITNKNVHIKNVGERYINSFNGLKYAVIFVAVATIVFSPWMVRNYLWKENPVYPLFRSVFNQKKPPTVSETMPKPKERRPKINAFWTRRYVYKESLGQTIAIPIRAFFQGQDDNPKYFDGKLNPALLLFSLIAFVRVRRKEEDQHLNYQKNFLAIFSILFIFFVLFQVDFRIRYMSPAIPALVVLTVFGIKNLFEILSKGSSTFKRVCIGGGVVLVFSTLTYNGLYIHQLFAAIQPVDYISGNIDEDTYISQYRIEHPVIMVANKILPDDAKVLCLSIGKRTYYVDRDVHLALDFYHRRKGTFTEKLIWNRLKRYGTTHIIFDRNNYLRWAKTIDPMEKSAFESVFGSHTRILYERDGVQLLEIV